MAVGPFSEYLKVTHGYHSSASVFYVRHHAESRSDSMIPIRGTDVDPIAIIFLTQNENMLSYFFSYSLCLHNNRPRYS